MKKCHLIKAEYNKCKNTDKNYEKIFSHIIFKILTSLFLLLSALASYKGMNVIFCQELPVILDPLVNLTLGLLFGLTTLMMGMCAAIYIFRFDGPCYEIIDKARAAGRKHVFLSFQNNENGITASFLKIIVATLLFGTIMYYLKHGGDKLLMKWLMSQ